MKGDIKRELDELGKNIVKDAKKNALPNKDTGKLDRSISYETSFISEDKFNIAINYVYYGDFLNKGTSKMKATRFLDKAVEKNLEKGLDSIIEVMAGEFLNQIKTNI